MASRKRILKSISQIYCVEKSVHGLTAGLYVFVYAEMLRTALLSANAGEAIVKAAGISAPAETWAVCLLVPITLLIFILEVPSGYLADWRGPRFAVTASWMFRSLFFAMFYLVVGPGNGAGAIVKLAYLSTVPFAIGYTLRSGANLTWLHWALVHNKFSTTQIEQNRNAINSRSWTYYWMVSLAGSLISILIYKRWPTLVFSIGFCVSGLVTAWLRWRMSDYRATGESFAAQDHQLDGFDHWELKARWATLIIVAVAAGVFMVLGDLVDHTWLMVGKSYRLNEVGGFHEFLLVLATGMAAILGSGVPTWIESKAANYSSFHSVVLFVTVAVAFGAPHIMVAQYPGVVSMMMFLFTKELIRGAFDGPKENLVNGLIPSRNKYRTTWISVVNQSGNLMVACVVIYIFVADKISHQPGRLLATWAYCGAALVIAALCVLSIASWCAGYGYKERRETDAVA